VCPFPGETFHNLGQTNRRACPCPQEPSEIPHPKHLNGWSNDAAFKSTGVDEKKRSEIQSSEALLRQMRVLHSHSVMGRRRRERKQPVLHEVHKLRGGSEALGIFYRNAYRLKDLRAGIPGAFSPSRPQAGTPSHRPWSARAYPAASGPTPARKRPQAALTIAVGGTPTALPNNGKAMLPGPAFALLRSSRRLALVV
jgi:hypothetical protein